MTSDTHEAAQAATRQLGGKWHSSYGMARCPAHDDSKPSLSITAGHTTVLYHCFAGCGQHEIMRALKMRRIERRSYRSAPTVRNPGGANRYKQLALDIWDKAKRVQGTPAELYLKKRGLNPSLFCRYDPAAITKEPDSDGVMVSLTLPALILPLHKNTDFTAIQRVFLDPDGNKADIADPKKILGQVDGGSIRLGLPDGRTLNLAEGFEDAQSAIQLHGLSHCWAVCGIEQYQHVEIPEGIQRIAIYSQHGKAAHCAIERARPHLCNKRRTLDILLPSGKGDWNDLVRETAQVD